MKEENPDLLANLEARVAKLENRIFGEIHPKPKRKVIEELLQINGQMNRSLANREVLSVLIKKVEEMMDYLNLEESSELLGGEAKGNAVLAAEPIIRQMHSIVKGIDLEKVHEAVNSEPIRKVIELSSQIAELRLVELDQSEKYRDLCNKIDEVEEVLSIMGFTMIEG